MLNVMMLIIAINHIIMPCMFCAYIEEMNNNEVIINPSRLARYFTSMLIPFKKRINGYVCNFTLYPVFGWYGVNIDEISRGINGVTRLGSFLTGVSV